MIQSIWNILFIPIHKKHYWYSSKKNRLNNNSVEICFFFHMFILTRQNVLFQISLSFCSMFSIMHNQAYHIFIAQTKKKRHSYPSKTKEKTRLQNSFLLSKPREYQYLIRKMAFRTLHLLHSRTSMHLARLAPNRELTRDPPKPSCVQINHKKKKIHSWGQMVGLMDDIQILCYPVPSPSAAQPLATREVKKINNLHQAFTVHRTLSEIEAPLETHGMDVFVLLSPAHVRYAPNRFAHYTHTQSGLSVCRNCKKRTVEPNLSSVRLHALFRVEAYLHRDQIPNIFLVLFTHKK